MSRRLRRTRGLVPGLVLILLGGAIPPAGTSIAAAPPPGAFGPDEPSGEVMSFWRELRAWRPGQGAAATVSGVTLVRDAAEFHLDEGTLTLLDIRGRTAAAVFEGSGRVRLHAPLEVERTHLARHLEWDTPEVEVERLFLLFADTTLAELRSMGDFEVIPLSGSGRDAARRAMEFLTGEDEGDLEESLVRTFLNGESTELFRAHIFRRRGDDLLFLFDGSADEEVSFGREAPRGRAFETVASFYRKSAYDADGRLVAPKWLTRPADALHYVARLDIHGLDEVVARTEVTLIPNVPGGSWIGAALFHELRVDSLRWGDGSPAVYDRSGDEVSSLWIRLPDGAAEGLPLTLKAWYRGDIVDRTPEGFYFVRTTSTWLPRFGSSQATYDLTFGSSDNRPVMSVGRRVSREVDPTDDDRVVTRWVTQKPSAQVTFSVGDFEEYEFPAEATRPIRIHVAEEFHRRFLELTSRAADATGGAINILSQRDPEEQVHRDIEHSLGFFTEAFGPLDFEEYNVAEIPGSHGQAFPGMINLSWLTFRWTDEEGFSEIFRAHEVAHQWWGIGVRPATYHDVWLSEGMSEFAALWYMHRIRANPQRYLERLKELREAIFDRRDEAGPVWLGPRVALGREGIEDYQVTVYSKGAWVMHMLRNLMLDHDTGSEEVFEGFMRLVFTRHQGRTISTAEFQSLLERYLGSDMQWFFNQWVYGTEIPKYRFAYTTEELASGEARMTVRIRQEGVPDDFMMVVPILLDFGMDGSAIVPVLIRGPEVVTELPILPRVPDDVTFNVLESVLAEVDVERW